MSLIVQKYGGTSVGTVDKIKAVAERIIKTKRAGNQIVVIVSAMGKTTDQMIGLMNQINPEPNPREYDQFISTGENVSAALLTMAIHAFGEEATSLSGWQAGVITEDHNSRAKILSIEPKRIKQELKHEKIVIVTGFQGINSKGDITTIGRSGSDTSAVAIAAGLHADKCEIYTDVEGVFSTDPRMVSEAVKLDHISHEEMLEMASLGAGVLHPRSVEVGLNHKMDIVVRDAHSEKEGTIVTQKKIEGDSAISGIAFDDKSSKISILKVPDVPGMAGKLFGALAEAQINVDMIVQSTHEEEGKNDISFTIPESDYEKGLEITKKIGEEIGAPTVSGDKEVAKISIIGVGMISTPGVAASMFNTLAQEGINIDMISTSEIKVSCIISLADMKKAVKALHKDLIE